MIRTKSTGRKIFEIINTSLLVGFVALCVLPIWHVICASISDPMHVLSTTGLILWPKGITFQGYTLVFGNQSIIRSFGNTLVYVSAATVIGMMVTAMGGYALSRKNLLWANAIMVMITFTMLFSGGIVPAYLLLKRIGLYNSPWVLILPMCVNTFNLIIVRTSMASIPGSLEESAKLDGASHFTIFWSIVLPLVKPTIATVTLYYAVFHWNSWFFASIFLRDRSLFPMQLVLKELLVANDFSSVSSNITAAEAADMSLNLSRELIKYCTIVISSLPIFCVYPFVQKYFESGVMIGAIKG